MRPLILICSLSLALAACGGDEQSANSAAPDDTQSAERMVANDVTAIDAVTGDAANMAADVNYLEVENLTANGAGNEAAPRARRAPASNAPTPAPRAQSPSNEAQSEPAGNSAE